MFKCANCGVQNIMENVLHCCQSCYNLSRRIQKVMFPSCDWCISIHFVCFRYDGHQYKTLWPTFFISVTVPLKNYPKACSLHTRPWFCQSRLLPYQVTKIKVGQFKYCDLSNYNFFHYCERCTRTV